MAEIAVLDNDGKVIENNSGVYPHKFKEPFSYEDKDYTELSFNFARLTGRDLLNVEESLRTKRNIIVAPAFDSDYLIEVAAKASGVDALMLELLPANEFLAIMGKTRNFLLL